MFPPTDDGASADLVCLGAERASTLATKLLFVALVAAATAWRWRDRAAASGHRTEWATVMLLLGFLHALGCYALIPTGCAASADVTVLAGSLVPWLLAAAFFRSGVPPAPPRFDTPPDPGA